MNKLSNDTLQKFLDCFVETLKREVEYGTKIDIPFIISSLYQSFNNDTWKYEEFVDDLIKYIDYNIIIEESSNDYNGIIDVTVSLARYNDICMEDISCPDYNYLLRFSYEDRDYGYCECTPDMPDYREDKHCCGHGCDASFCSFSLHKVLNIVSDSWHGDKHDYWKFEDEFYASDKELADKKKEEDRVMEIEELKNRISADSKRLAELTDNK